VKDMFCFFHKEVERQPAPCIFFHCHTYNLVPIKNQVKMRGQKQPFRTWWVNLNKVKDGNLVMCHWQIYICMPILLLIAILSKINLFYFIDWCDDIFFTGCQPAMCHMLLPGPRFVWQTSTCVSGNLMSFRQVPRQMSHQPGPLTA
jgi:hypothetical protein